MKWLMKFFIVIAFVIGINYFILNDLNEIIVDKNASKIFKEAFKIENLIDHKVILKKEKLFVIINFNDKLKKSEI